MRTCVLLAVLGAVAAGTPALPQVASNGGTRVVLLGTGMPQPDPDRSGPATAIVVNGEAYIVDAGAGVVRRASAAARADSIPALRPANLTHLFLTHLHSDHTLGLPDFMLTSAPGRRERLAIFGPEGTQRMVRLILEAYSEDIQVRTAGLQQVPASAYIMDAHDVRPGVIYRDSNVTVTAFAVQHGDWREALGYRFDTKDRSVVVSGDTRPTDAIVAACHGCDVLVHEVYSEKGWQRLPEGRRAYHGSSHTSGPQLGDIAARAQPKLLVLTHFVPMGETVDEIADEVRSRFKGVVAVGRDLGVY